MDKLAAPPLSRIADVARRAGVSTATVDRVLNRRPGVRPITLQRVLTAASELDYMPAEDLLAAMKPKPMRLLFLLPKGTNRFLSMLGQLIAHSEARLAALQRPLPGGLHQELQSRIAGATALAPS